MTDATFDAMPEAEQAVRRICQRLENMSGEAEAEMNAMTRQLKATGDPNLERALVTLQHWRAGVVDALLVIEDLRERWVEDDWIIT